MRRIECWDGSAWTIEMDNQVAATNLVGEQVVFRFFDEDGAEIDPGAGELSAADRARIRLVMIEMRLMDPDDPVEGENPEFDLSARVRLPNLS